MTDLARRSVLALVALFSCFILPAAAQDRQNIFPNLAIPWESNLGEVYWLGGYIEGPDNYLIWGHPELDTATQDWVFKGRWGQPVNGKIVSMGSVTARFSYKQYSGAYSDTFFYDEYVAGFEGQLEYDDGKHLPVFWEGEKTYKVGGNDTYELKSIGNMKYPTGNSNLVAQMRQLRDRPNALEEREFDLLDNLDFGAMAANSSDFLKMSAAPSPSPAPSEPMPATNSRVTSCTEAAYALLLDIGFSVEQVSQGCIKPAGDN